MPLIRQPALIEENIRNYCEYLKRKFVECTDFKKLRQFLLEVIDKIVFKFDDILITGFIPVGIVPDFYDYCEPRHGDDHKLEFNIQLRNKIVCPRLNLRE